MTQLNVNTIEPAGATLNIGASGDTIKVNDSVNVNTVKDSGGNTLWVSNGSGVLSSVNSGFGDALVLLSTQTGSGHVSIDFTSGIDSTYKEYIFKFININPDTDNIDFSFQANVVGGSDFNETMTTTFFRADHDEADSSATLGYQDWADQSNGTAYQFLNYDTGGDADQNSVGELHLFDPSSTTYIKNFYSVSQYSHYANASQQAFVAGYFNTTEAIDEISFKMASGNFDGTIKMYGVK